MTDENEYRLVQLPFSIYPFYYGKNIHLFLRKVGVIVAFSWKQVLHAMPLALECGPTIPPAQTCYDNEEACKYDTQKLLRTMLNQTLFQVKYD